MDIVKFASNIGGYQRAATVLAELVNVIDMSKNVTSMPMPVYSILFNATKLQKKIRFLEYFMAAIGPFCAEKRILA